jgi:hypothetical protein
MKSYLPSFKGKVLSVLCKSEDSSQMIWEPKFEIQGGRLFLVGMVPPESSQDNWMEGLPSAISWDSVQDYVIFDSVEDYLKRLKGKSPKRKKK